MDRSPIGTATKPRMRLGWRLLGTGVICVGLAALLVLVTGVPFKQGLPSLIPVQVTPTAVPPTATPAPLTTTNTSLMGISMVSATEGWTVGVDVNSTATRLLHLKGGVWKAESLPQVKFIPRTITMVSATDGWIGGSDDSYPIPHGMMLHLTGGNWVPIPLPSETGSISSIAMVSAAEGWAVDDLSASGHSHIQHYAQGAWTIAKTMPDSAKLRSVSMVSPAEGWVAGVVPGLGSTPGALWHYTDGTWQPVTPSDPNNADVESVSMLPSGEGWGIGGYGYELPGDQKDIRFAGVIWHYSGGQWQVVKRIVDNSGRYQTTFLSAVQALSNGGVEALGADSAPAAWQSAAGTWQRQTLPDGQNIGVLNALAMVSADEGWAVGEGGIMLHYANGTWTRYPAR